MKLNYFNFKQYGKSILMTNDFGKYMFVSKEDFRKILSLDVDRESELYESLIEKKMIYDESDLEYSSINKYALREIKGHVNVATSLHIFVVTTVCNMSCIYCQANNGVESSYLIMNKEMAEKAVDIALQSPEQSLCFEFQGGEPLVNFDLYIESPEGTVARLTPSTKSRTYYVTDFVCENPKGDWYLQIENLECVKLFL